MFNEVFVEGDWRDMIKKRWRDPIGREEKDSKSKLKLNKRKNLIQWL